MQRIYEERFQKESKVLKEALLVSEKLGMVGTLASLEVPESLRERTKTGTTPFKTSVDSLSQISCYASPREKSEQVLRAIYSAKQSLVESGEGKTDQASKHSMAENDEIAVLALIVLMAAQKLDHLYPSLHLVWDYLHAGPSSSNINEKKHVHLLLVRRLPFHL